MQGAQEPRFLGAEGIGIDVRKLMGSKKEKSSMQRAEIPSYKLKLTQLKEDLLKPKKFTTASEESDEEAEKLAVEAQAFLCGLAG